ncbi:STAS domain-containing protein [Kangiella sediminilitoris]|uniref:Anti-sigma factor antagonist n=1 Tax=Kangiella sediminilitoris TaxID=1144748 RepID=A0A1B3B8T1_9GAMM|nr:STAS domain-containing protein [Kangiella sediminilitoris]AOE49214.1 Anti-sigma factor antagonist [Kangiella sediminilitoris]
MPLDIEVGENGEEAARLSLDGSLDSDTAPKLEQYIGNLNDSVKAIVFDMKELKFISSAGLRVIFSTLKKQKAKGGKVAVSNMSPGVKKVFEIVKALPDFTVFANTEEMDNYLAQFQK